MKYRQRFMKIANFFYCRYSAKGGWTFTIVSPVVHYVLEVHNSDALWLNEIFTYKSFQILPMVTWAEFHTITINFKWKMEASKSLKLQQHGMGLMGHMGLMVRCHSRTPLMEVTTVEAIMLDNNKEESFVRSLSEQDFKIKNIFFCDRKILYVWSWSVEDEEKKKIPLNSCAICQCAFCSNDI